MKTAFTRTFVPALLVLFVLAAAGCAKKAEQAAPAMSTTAATTAATTAETTAATTAETDAATTAAPETTQEQTVPVPEAFELSELHDLVRAEAVGEFGTVKTESFDSLRWIEQHFSTATGLNGWPNCPYDMVIRLTRKDGKVFEVQPATDSCDNMLVGGNDWYCFNNGGSNVILFDLFNLEALAGTVTKRAPLPAYKYSGDDGVMKALTEYFIAGNPYSKENGATVIPNLVIIKKEEDADGNVKVYGNFWLFVYAKRGTALYCESGGENPGVVYLKRTGDNAYEVTKFDAVESGSDYYKDIDRICAGDARLREKFSDSANTSSELYNSWKNWFLYSYVKENDLNIDSMQDYKKDPVPITPADRMPEI